MSTPDLFRARPDEMVDAIWIEWISHPDDIDVLVATANCHDALCLINRSVRGLM